jgi:serine protease Do
MTSPARAGRDSFHRYKSHKRNDFVPAGKTVRRVRGDFKRHERRIRFRGSGGAMERLRMAPRIGSVITASLSLSTMQHLPVSRRPRTTGAAALLVLIFAVASRASENPRETPVVRALKKARRAVVNIHSEKISRGGDPVFGTLRPRKVNGMGTGIVVDARGYIVTNYHVVDGVSSLRVTLVDGSTYSAAVVATDHAQDLAIIRIRPGKPLPVMPMGTSSDLMLGESVIAVGNAYGYENTVTSGIVSALSRDVEVNEKQAYKNLIQTDASINPGNSGGPLINMAGEVIGINVAIRAGAQRIGFAIPIDDARRVIARLLNVERLERHYHGLVTRDAKSARRRELVVTTAPPLSPAAKAGFEPGDVVLKVADRKVVDRVDFERSLLGRKTGEKVRVVVRRQNAEKTLALALSPFNGPTVVRANNQQLQSDDDNRSAAWTTLGLQIEKIKDPAAVMRHSHYRGGMRVVAVRPNSPAAINGIRSGDILVGLHIWETVNADNVSYVLSHPQLGSFSPLKFYVLRGKETLFGYLTTGK